MEQFDSERPFILYRRPYEEQYILHTDIELQAHRLVAKDVYISTWLNRPVEEMTVEDTSTSQTDYLHTVAAAKENACKRNGKTVIMRTICGVFQRFNPLELAQTYFKSFPGMFCFLFYHPSTGYWMGASPELLVERQGTKAATRALAGTMPEDISCEWDTKNIEEHRMVINDISANIKTLGDEWIIEVGQTSTLRYGNIRHLCTPITISKGSTATPLSPIINVLHPTAAVGGYPRDKAIADIDKLESRQRKFYGGVIADSTMAYVILRCVHFDRHRWCVYSGSGITGLSDPLDEWRETQAKATPLLSLLGQF